MPPEKSAKKSAPGKPFKKGGDPRQGRGPQKGAPNAGRPPDEWKEKMRELASREDIMAHVEAVLSNPGHPQWFNALKWVGENGYGKPGQEITHKGDSTAPLAVKIIGYKE